MNAVAVLKWFATRGGDVLTGHLLSVAVERVQAREWAARLAGRAIDRLDVPVDRDSLRLWLERPETADLLVAPSEMAMERLVQTAREALWEDESDESAKAAEAVVAAVVGEFLFELDPSAAIGVAHYREMQLLEQIAAAVGIRDEDFSEILEHVPSPIRLPLASARAADPAAVGRLLELILSEDPAAALAGLFPEPPAWCSDASFDLWRAAAEAAASYGVDSVASALFQKLADEGAPPRSYLYARSALHAAQDGDTSRAEELLGRARDFGESGITRLIEAALAGDEEARVAAAEDVPVDGAPAEALHLARMLQADAFFVLHRWDDALRAADEVLTHIPDHSGARILKARCLLARRATGGSESAEADLIAARDIALEARDLRRKWRGASEEAAYWACVAMLLASDWAGVLRIALRPPFGEAIPREWEAQLLLPPVAAAAIGSRRLDVAEEAIGRIEDPFEHAYNTAWLHERQDVSAEQVEREYRAAWDLASDDEQRRRIQTSLALLPAWPIPGLDELRAQDEREADLLLALSEAERGSHEEALDRVRRWAPQSRQATSLLARIYEQKGDIEAGAAALEDGYRRFSDVQFLVERAELLFRGMRLQDAQQQAEAALGLLVADVHAKTALRKLLLEVGAQRGLWQLVEDHARALISSGDAEPDARWALILSLLQRGALDEAWATYNRDAPLAPVTETQARLWLELHRHFASGETGVRSVLDVARLFRDSEQVFAAAILTIHELARDVTLPSELTAEVQQEADRFFEAFPGSEILWRVGAEDEANLVKNLREVLPRDTQRPRELAEAVNLARYPVGVLAAAVGRSYTEVLVRGAAGVLPVHAMDPAVVELERRAAEGALDRIVVTEPSVLNIFSVAQNHWDSLSRLFASVILADSATRDLIHGRDVLSWRSTGTLTWDEAQDRPLLIEISEEEAESAATRSAWMANTAMALAVRSHPHLEHFPNADIDRLGSWLAAVDLAAKINAPLWSDDSALRALARSVGVAAFDSVSLFEEAVEAGRIPRDSMRLFLLDLRRAYAVELPYDEQQVLLLQAEENWEPRRSALPITRPHFWIDGATALRRLGVLVAEVAEHAPDKIPAWLEVATRGCLRFVNDDSKSDVAASILTFFILKWGLVPDRLRALVDRAREIGATVGGFDPYPAAIAEVADALRSQHGPSEAAKFGVAVVASLDLEDRMIALRSLLVGGTGLMVPPVR